jgi:hypothetical protein
MFERIRKFFSQPQAVPPPPEPEKPRTFDFRSMAEPLRQITLTSAPIPPYVHGASEGDILYVSGTGSEGLPGMVIRGHFVELVASYVEEHSQHSILMFTTPPTGTPLMGMVAQLLPEAAIVLGEQLIEHGREAQKKNALEALSRKPR